MDPARHQRSALALDGRRAATAPLVGQADGQADARRQLVAQARAHLDKLAERMNLLARGAGAAGLPGADPQAPLSPKAQRLVDYLKGKLGADPRLARDVQVALHRFHETAISVGWPAGDAPPTLDEEALRVRLYQLANLFVAFRGDALLAAVFPAPDQAALAPRRFDVAPPKPKPNAERAKQAVLQARKLHQDLARKMAVLQRALEDVDHGIVRDLGALFTPEGRRAKVLAGAVWEDRAAIARMREAALLYKRLGLLLARVGQPGFDPDALAPLVLPLGELASFFREPPILHELFAAA